MAERALDPPTERVDVVVIGGGLAGIAAAARLRERGVRAVIVEAERELGGKVRAVDAPGVAASGLALSRGPIVWEAKRESVTRLMSLLGLERDVVPTLPAKARWVVRNGKLCALEPSPRSLLTTRALGVRDRARILAELALPRAAPTAVAALGSAADERAADESLASFFRRRFGHDVAEGLLFAMANGIWAGDPERLSAAACFPDMVAAERDHGSVIVGTVQRLRAAARTARTAAAESSTGPQGAGPRRGSLTLAGGLGRVGGAARAQLDARTGVRVDAIERSADGALVRARDVDGRALSFAARAVVVATEAPAARALLAPALAAERHGGADRSAAIASILGEVTYSPIALVHWREKRAAEARLPAGFGYLAAPRERMFALGTLFPSDALPDLADATKRDGGRRTFSSFVGGALTPERARLTDDELARGIASDVGRLTGGRFGELLHVERVALAVAQPTLGHGARMTRLADLLADGPFTVAGSWLGSGAMKDAVESGFAAADDVVARLARAAAVGPGATHGDERAAERPAPRLHVVHGERADRSEKDTYADDVIEPGHESAEQRADRVGTAPFAVVGASYRDVATEVRAKLAALEQGPDAPSQALVEAGYADGVVFLETCSRVEWLVSSNRPAWAAEILKSTLAKRVPETRVHTKTGHAAAHYLLRVAMGLDSVAEGEPAVGRQLVLAFEKAHKDGAADRSLRLAWRAVQQLMGERRRRGVVQHGLGVQTLVLEELAAKGVQKSDEILVFGQGEIGRAVSTALREHGYAKASAHRRSTQLQFMAEAERARAVVVCTGGPAAFVELPTRASEGAAGPTRGAPLVIDIGVPTQVKTAPGWTLVVLEDLLMQPRRMLDDDTRAWLVEQVATFADRLSKDLADPVPATALGAIDEARRVFLRETLPPLLAKLPPSSAEELRRACVTFAHHLMERVRDANGGNGSTGNGGASGGAA